MKLCSRYRYSFVGSLLPALCLLFHSQAACAQTSWVGGVANWFDPANWSNGVPTASGSAEIDNGGTARIDSAGAAARDLYLGFDLNESGSLLVSGAGSYESANSLVVGNVGVGMLTLREGATASSMVGSIGSRSNAQGSVLVDGSGSRWTNSGALFIGDMGSGILTIQNGGAVFSGAGTIAGNTQFSGGNGTAFVDGVGSVWDSSGSITVDGALTLRNAGQAVSDSGWVNGTALIDGAGSSWSTGSFQVGTGHGLGKLTIRNGGLLTTEGNCVIGNSPTGGLVQVEGVSSSWNNDFDRARLHLGSFGSGELRISSGGTVANFLAGVGVSPGQSGVVLVNEAGSAWNIRTNLYVGGGDFGTGGVEGGTGLVSIANGARVRAAETTIFRQGQLIDDATLTSPMVSIAVGGLLGGGGQVAGDVTNDGSLAPGDILGRLTIDGNLTQNASGALIIEIGGVEPENADDLQVTGNARLEGTLEVRFVNGFLPRSGDVFRVVQVGGAVSGSFAQILFPDLQAGFEFEAKFIGNVFQITALKDGVRASALRNISTRGRVGINDDALIAGFIVTGNAAKKVIVRALGPSLAVNGMSLPGRLADPTLELRDESGALITFNDNWMEGGQRDQIVASTVPPADAHEAAIVATLAPGNYTAIMRGAGNTTGLGIVEIYDLEPQASARIVNISSRGIVATGDQMLIGGFIAGNQANEVLLRAIGPSLAQFGIVDALADPTLELHDSDGEVVAFNDNWCDADEASIAASGLAPTDERESAIIANLAPGNYTAIVRGNNETSGVGLFEVYNLR